MQPKLRRLVKAALRELRGSSAVDLPGGRYRLAWGARHSIRLRQTDYPMLFDLARDRSCVFDVGAKVGMTAMCMSGAMPKGTVFAFEAAETSCFVLNRNIELNGLEGRIVAVNTIVGATSGDLCEYYWSLISGRSGIVMSPPAGAVPVQKLAVSLDDFVGRNGLWPDLVKIDVEGAEHQVLVGMQGVIRTCKPDIALELHAWPGMSAEANTARIENLLEPLDYRMFWLDTGQFLEDPGVLASLEAEKSGVQSRARFLLMPRGRSVPLERGGCGHQPGPEAR